MTKRVMALSALLVLLASVVLAACAPQETIVEVTRVVTETEVVESEPETIEVTRVVEVEGEGQTVEVEVTRVVEVAPEEPEMSEEEMTRTGGWLDTIVILEEPNADAGVARLIAGDLDVYADDVGGQAALNAVAAENVETRTQYGLFDELTFNLATCQDENLLNPFSNTQIRASMNRAFDREFIANELYQGLAVPKYSTIAEASADRAKFAAEIQAINNEYAFDLERATEEITAEMEAMGATLEDGTWTYNGNPISLNFLIRIEDTRLEIGNYIATILEDMGFVVERTERTSGELSPLWIDGDPTLCEWHLYTGAWSQSAIDRESTFSFEQYYTNRVLPWPLWQLYDPPQELSDASLRVFNTDFATIEERNETVAAALPLTMEYSPRNWITSRLTLVPFSTEVDVATDLAGGISGSAIWARTIRLAGEVGGSINIGLPSIFTEPWNPVGGSNWVFDAMVQRGIGETATYADPSTGVPLPNRIERAEVVVTEGFPTGKQDTSEWLTLTFEPEVVVPDDAWAGWDAENQVFLTAADVYTETQTAVRKSTVYYPENFDGLTWHDGSPFSAADVVQVMIATFDLANPASPYYDESLESGLQQFLSAFKGVRIVSTEPLVIETWSDAGALDAENMISTWWPYDNDNTNHGFGGAAWHNMAIMLRGEENGGFAFTPDKAESNEVERTNLIAGPSLEVLATELAAAAEEGFIPWAPTMSQYITAEEAAERYANLAEFARRYGHYYVATGPYFLSGVFPVEGQAVLTHYAAHPDLASRYAAFGAPALPVVAIDGPGRVTIGEEAAFEVFIDVFDGPYPTEDLTSVEYLVYDAEGNLAGRGPASVVEEGVWEVVLGGDVTGALVEGSSTLDLVVVSNLVAIPGLGSFEFVAAP